MKKWHLTIIVILLMIGGVSFRSGHLSGVDRTVSYFKTEAGEFSASTQTLLQKIKDMDSSRTGIEEARSALANCRLHYKKIEFFLEYFFTSAAHVYNAAPKYEVEEPYMEYQEPVGMQLMEGWLFDKDVAAHKKDLLQQALLLQSSAADLPALLYGFEASDAQVLESLRLELIRVMALHISGYDAPQLKTGIREALSALQSMQVVLLPYLTHSAAADSVSACLSRAVSLLKNHPDFDTFDRLGFLTNAALPLQHFLNLLCRQKDLALNTVPALNDSADNLFSPDAIDITAFPHTVSSTPQLAALGKALFFEKKLSGDRSRSCATCHQPANFFTDGLPRSRTLDNRSFVSRNAPTLMYAGYQYKQFWDARVQSLEDQVVNVLLNPEEMHADTVMIVKMLASDKHYQALFETAYGKGTDSLFRLGHVTASIAAFVRSLRPFNAPFDRYMQGEKEALNASQKQGFNLFMGKAQCGTCHFIPLFNGLTPPLYNLSELEVLGTTETDDLSDPHADTDLGKFNTFPISFYKRAFKTPSLRDVAHTAPYMHNGAFHSLQEVLDFYNKGGGNGLGLSVETQTLSADSLGLTQGEIDSIRGFLESLSDTLPPAYGHINDISANGHKKSHLKIQNSP